MTAPRFPYHSSVRPLTYLVNRGRPLSRDVEASGETRCHSCRKMFYLSDLHILPKLTLCLACWAEITAAFAESYPDLAHVSAGIYETIEPTVHSEPGDPPWAWKRRR
mgnify:CR=1 FL=1